MSNLPVLWVPPVAPPDPDERPPKRRGNRGVLLAAAAIVGLPVLALAMQAAVSKTPEPAAIADVSAPAAAAPAAKTAAEDTRIATGPSPETSGGNQPYIAAPTPPAATAPAAPAPAATAPAASQPAPVAAANRAAGASEREALAGLGEIGRASCRERVS
jgi:hypothetical protein